MSDKPTVTIDLSGLPCPAPLLGAKKIIDDLQAGQTMLLLSDCPGSSDDLHAWCKFTGNEMLSSPEAVTACRALPQIISGCISRVAKCASQADMKSFSAIVCPAALAGSKATNLQ